MKTLLVYVNMISEGYLPVNLASVAGAAVNAGHEVKIFDTSFYTTSRRTDREAREEYNEFQKHGPDLEQSGLIKKTASEMYLDWINTIDSFKPGLIGISATSTEFPSARALMEISKKKFPKIPIIVGGTHPSVASERTIKEPSLDMICVGEGEDAFVELLNSLARGADCRSIANIWTKQDGKIYKNDVRPLIQDLDSLPYPAWSLFDNKHFIRPFENEIKQYGFFEFSRGCPFSCSYCVNDYLKSIYKGKGKYHREKSAKRMLEEISAFKREKDINHIFFIDDEFLTINADTLKEFAEGYSKYVNVTNHIMSRPERITPKNIEILNKINTVMVLMGLESGSTRIRKEICNRNMTEQHLHNAISLLRDAGIMSSLYNMIGFPTETREEIFETIEANRRLKPDRMTVKIFCPFEGTATRKMAIDQGYMPDCADITKMYYEDTELNMPQLSPDEIRGLRKTFNFYVEFPRELWPNIRLSEGNSEEAKQEYKRLADLYWKNKRKR